jgi:hypothetical protein
VGDVLNLRVPRLNANAPCSVFDEVPARVVHVGTHAIALEDTLAPLAGRTDATYIDVVREYDRDMHGILLENFGNPFALGSELANTAQVYMLFTRTVNDAAPGVAGFVFSGDLFDRSLCNQSNRAAIFYAMVPTDSSASFQVDGGVNTWKWQMRSTIIHEVKHVISFVERLQRGGSGISTFRPEESWLEESTARVSEELWARRVFGYSATERVTYAQSIYCEVRPSWPECAGSPLAMRKHYGGVYDYLVSGGSRSPLWTEDSSFYGSGWSLVRWAIAHSGRGEAAFLRELTQDHTRTGIDNLEARTGKPWSEILPAWSLGMAVSGLAGFAPSRSDLVYPGWNIASIFQGLNTDFPSRFTRAAPQYTALGAGAFTRPAVPLRGGAGPVFELNASQQLRAVQLRGPENAPVGSNVGVAIVRLD